VIVKSLQSISDEDWNRYMFSHNRGIVLREIFRSIFTEIYKEIIGVDFSERKYFEETLRTAIDLEGVRRPQQILNTAETFASVESVLSE
jgi:hypothetical protein